MFRISTPLSQTLRANPMTRLCFGGRRTETVGVDISSHALQTVTISVRDSETNRQAGMRNEVTVDDSVPVATWPFAWESRTISQFPQPISDSSSGRSAPATSVILNAIEQYLPRQADGGTRIACAVLPPAATVLRWPNMEQPADLGKSIRSNLGQSLTSSDSIESCSWPVGDSGRRMIYAVSGGMTSALANQMTQFGFHCPIVDSRPHALARATQLDKSDNAHIIIEWSWYDCILLIASKSNSTVWRVPQLCRPLHGYSLSANERIGSSSSSVRSNQRAHDMNGQSFLPLFRAAAEEIQRTLRFAETLPGIDVSGPILICGPAASIVHAVPVLSESLDREVRIWGWGGGKRPPQHELEPIDALFTVAIGAACGATI